MSERKLSASSCDIGTVFPVSPLIYGSPAAILSANARLCSSALRNPAD